jgi:hypothetical protein
MHGQGRASIGGSVEYLKCYVMSLGWSNSSSQAYPSAKGKEKIWEGERRAIGEEDNSGPSGVMIRWTLPGSGWAKLNTNASYCQRTGIAGIGVVAWDSQGTILLSAWHFLNNVASAEEAEALACDWRQIR